MDREKVNKIKYKVNFYSNGIEGDIEEIEVIYEDELYYYSNASKSGWAVPSNCLAAHKKSSLYDSREDAILEIKKRISEEINKLTDKLNRYE